MATIPFTVQHQLAPNWCWCAVSVSVDLFFTPGSIWTQCAMASKGLRKTGCCNTPIPQPCDQPGLLDKALRIVKHLAGGPTAGPISFAQVQQTLAAGRPVCARIGWLQGGGHFVAISGWSIQGGIQRVNVEDPLYGSSVVGYTNLCTAYHYGRGRWTHTYPVA